jgi:hemoglobin-like flavoprotein
MGPVTPEQITLVESSIEQLRSGLDELATDFYRRLFAAEPEVRVLFTTDVVEQQRRFVEQLDAIVHAIRDFDAFSAVAAELGLRHQTYGVCPRHYVLAGPPLLAAIAAALGERWTTDVEAAWRRAYNLTAEAMMAGAADVHSYGTVTRRSASASWARPDTPSLE